MIVCRHSPSTVPELLLSFLQERLGRSGLRFTEPPAAINSGWDTFIYRFQLAAHEPLEGALAGPLILRVYASREGWPRLRHECAVQRHVARLGYPVAEPLLCEEDCDRFGGPFMVMQCLPGRTLLDDMLGRPWKILGGPHLLAEVHHQLHSLPTDGFPAAGPPLLGRTLAEMERQVDEYALDGLRRGLEWLRTRQPAPPAAPSILHLDFHPANFMIAGGRCQGILDWNEAALGDRHADLATTLVLIRSAPVEVPLTQQLLTGPGRWLLRGRYLQGYRCRHPIDEDRLHYYTAWAALRRLCRYGMWLRAGPPITGSKPTSIRYVNARRVGILARCFERPTGIRLPVDEVFGVRRG